MELKKHDDEEKSSKRDGNNDHYYCQLVISNLKVQGSLVAQEMNEMYSDASRVRLTR